jgi:hypothetical protein
MAVPALLCPGKPFQAKPSIFDFLTVFRAPFNLCAVW